MIKKLPAVGKYFLRKPPFGSTSSPHGWTLERVIESKLAGKMSYMIATFDGGVSVGEVEKIIEALNATDSNGCGKALSARDKRDFHKTGLIWCKDCNATKAQEVR